MTVKTLTVGLPESLFDGFVSFFPYRLAGRIFVLSTWRLLLYSCLLCIFAANTALSLSFTPIPVEAAKYKVAFFLSGLAHCLSLFLCLVGVLWHKEIVNLPFLHFEFGVTYLRSAGINPKLQCPLYYNIGSYLIPMLVVLPDVLLLELDAFRIIFLLNDYLMVYFIYLLLLRIFGFLNVLEGALFCCKDSLFLLGDGINYIGKTYKIECLIIAFNHLCSSSVILSQLFSMNLMTAVSVAFIGSTTSVYIIIVVSQSSLPNEFVQQMILSNFLDLITYCCITFSLVNLCTSCVREIKEFNGILYEQMIDDRNDEILLNRKLNLHILMKREVEFTACGFFSIDYTLIHSMVAAASTYLVVLIQFSPLSAPSSAPDNSDSTAFFNNKSGN